MLTINGDQALERKGRKKEMRQIFPSSQSNRFNSRNNPGILFQIIRLIVHSFSVSRGKRGRETHTYTYTYIPVERRKLQSLQVTESPSPVSSFFPLNSFPDELRPSFLCKIPSLQASYKSVRHLEMQFISLLASVSQLGFIR